MADDFGMTPGLPDEAFENDGLITKRQLRASALAQLRPQPGELLWDVGTGSGAIAIEWCRAAAGTRAVGLERNVERAARARRNAQRLAPGAVSVIIGDADDLLANLATPDAVFVGGGASPQVLADCWAALRPHGRIVVHGVTVETEALCLDWYRQYGGSLSRILVEQVEPLGRYLSWTPRRPVMEWACTKQC